MLRLAFLASHAGSTARHITMACRDGRLSGQSLVMVSNNSNAEALVWAREAGLQTAHISSAIYPDPEELDSAISDFLTVSGADTLVLSGYLKRVGDRVLDAFEGNVLNIHPSLLPKYGGKGFYGDYIHNAVLRAGEHETGATVHFVTGGIDEGPIMAQQRVPVLSDDTIDSLRARVQAIEGDLMLKALKELDEDLS